MRHSRYFVGCTGAAFALTAFALALEISPITPAPSAEQTRSMVNRTLKGDRLPLTPGQSRNAVNGPVENAVNGPIELNVPPAPAPKSELLMGCEPIVSSIGQSPLARVAGRCLS